MTKRYRGRFEQGGGEPQRTREMRESIIVDYVRGGERYYIVLDTPAHSRSERDFPPDSATGRHDRAKHVDITLVSPPRRVES